jgi:hypothetical protein
VRPLLPFSLLLLGVAGPWVCARQPPAPTEAQRPGASRPELDAAPVTLGPAHLDRFIAYQARVRGLQAELLAAAPEALAQELGRVAQAEEQLAQELQLTERELEALEAVVGDVLSKRALARVEEGTGEEAARSLAELAVGLAPERREELEAVIAQLQAKEEAESLEAERARHGGALVALVLSREVDLLREWNATLALFAQDPEPPSGPSRRLKKPGTR